MGEFGFLPFGEFKPDQRKLINNGLVVAEGVIPVYGDYISSPALSRISAEIATNLDGAFGLHVDPVTATGYIGVQTTLRSVTEAGVIANVSRTVGGAYAVPDFTSGWMGCNFGTTVVMAGYSGAAGIRNAVQYKPTGVATFENMITTTFEPRARFCFPFRNNLFLANCFVPAAYDTLLGNTDYPNLVAWCRNDDVRQFGSQNINPEMIGADYQPLGFDIGEITGGIACAEFAIVGHSNGMSRIDGPPYSFRVVDSNLGMLFPYALCTVGNDVYYWSPAGLTRLRNGAGPAEVLGGAKFIRSLIDNSTGFFDHPANTTVSAAVIDCSMAYDAINGLLFVSYTQSNDGLFFARALLAYNIAEDRLTWFQLLSGGAASQIRFLRPGRQGNSTAWSPGRDIRFVEVAGEGTANSKYYGKMVLGNSGMSSVLKKGYVRHKDDRTVRYKRIRPIYSVTDQAAIEQISLTIDSVNKPYGVPTTTGPYTAADPTGWIVCPDSIFADFHAPKFTITANANMHKLVEYTGYEYEIELGPLYGA